MGGWVGGGGGVGGWVGGFQLSDGNFKGNKYLGISVATRW